MWDNQSDYVFVAKDKRKIDTSKLNKRLQKAWVVAGFSKRAMLTSCEMRKAIATQVNRNGKENLSILFITIF